MKRGMILSVVIAILLVSVTFADLTVTDFTLGDSNTMRMNPEGDDDGDQIGDTETATFTVTNNGTAVSGASVSFSGTLATDFNLSTDAPATWPNGTTIVTVTGQFPKDWDSLTEDEDEQAILAGEFTVNGNNVTAATGNMYAEAEPGLTLNDVEIVIDDLTYDYDDDEVKEIMPGADVSIQFVVENMFDKDSNIEIDNVKWTLESSNRDFDFDKDDDDFDLREEDDDTVSVDFDIDWDDVEDGDDATITITVEGTDDNGATHEITLEFDIEVEYPRADVDINGFSVSPSSVCAGDRVTVSYDIENVGTDDQDNLRGKIEETSLDWEEIIDRFTLDGRDDADTEEESFIESFTVPSNAVSGEYSVKVYAYFEDEDGDEDYKWESKALTVIDCEDTGSSSDDDDTSSDDTSSSDGMVVGGTTTSDGSTTADTSASTSPSTVTATSKPKSNDGLLIAGLIVLVVLLAGVVVSMVLMLKK